MADTDFEVTDHDGTTINAKTVTCYVRVSSNAGKPFAAPMQHMFKDEADSREAIRMLKGYVRKVGIPMPKLRLTRETRTVEHLTIED